MPLTSYFVAKQIHEFKKTKPSKIELEKFVCDEFMVAPENARNYLNIVETAFKAGVNSVVTGGLSDKGIKFGVDELFDGSFDFGKAEFTRLNTPLYIRIFKKLMPVLIIVIIIYFVASSLT